MKGHLVLNDKKTAALRMNLKQEFANIDRNILPMGIECTFER